MKLYIIGPSSKLVDHNEIDPAVEKLTSLGFDVELDSSVAAVHTRFSGEDDQRAGGFTRAAQSDADIVMSSRGGYGISRILHKIDWELLKNRPKTYVGYSDFTAFSLALLKKTGLPSYSGVDAIPDFSRQPLNENNIKSFTDLMFGRSNHIKFETSDTLDVSTEGVLWGGNLAMIVSTLGTPYFPEINNGILFIEDVGEHPFRIERLMIQLLHAGVFERQKAVILGNFTAYKLQPQDNGYELNTALNWIKQEVGLPFVDGLPYGHGVDRITLPFGRSVKLDVRDGLADITIL